MINPATRGPKASSNPPTVEAAPTLLRIGKESLPAIDDDPDPSEPTGPEIIYSERVCPVCGKPVSDNQTYDKDACRKQADRARAALGHVTAYANPNATRAQPADDPPTS